MSFQAMAWAAGQKVGGVTGKAILLMLANYADRDGACIPGQDKLAEECECSPRAVREWLARFETMGLIRREERRRDNGYRTSDRITLNLDARTPISPAPDAVEQAADTAGDQPAAGSPEPFSPENNADLTGTRCRAITSQGNRKPVVSEREPSQLDELAKVLDPEHAAAVVEHRKNFKAKFTPYAAKLLAKDFAACPDPNAAADEMIKNGWQGFRPKWVADRNSGLRVASGHGPPKRDGDRARSTLDRMIAEADGDASRPPNDWNEHSGRTLDGYAEKRAR